MYSFPSPKKTGPLVVISVVSFGGGLFGTESTGSDGLTYITNGDAQALWAGLNISQADMPKVAIKLVDGAVNAPLSTAYPYDVDGGTYENTMDVGMIGACCPTSRLVIVLFIAPNTYGAFLDVFTAASSSLQVTDPATNAVVTVKPSVMSVSWGAPETDFGSSFATQVNNVSGPF